MKRFDQSSAKCHIFTYKEGLLSPFAHDLRINVGSFVVVLFDKNMINARFDAGSLHADCAMVGEAERPDLLSDADRKEINESIRREVLHAETYGEISFRSEAVEEEGSSYRVRGTLGLHGTEKQIAFGVRRQGGYLIAEANLHLPDYGIKPLNALFGAVRIKPDILIQVMLPIEKA